MDALNPTNFPNRPTAYRRTLKSHGDVLDSIITMTMQEARDYVARLRGYQDAPKLAQSCTESGERDATVLTETQTNPVSQA